MSQERSSIVSPHVGNPIPDLIPHAVKANGLVFVSGSIGFDKDCKLVEGGITEHTVGKREPRRFHAYDV